MIIDIKIPSPGESITEVELANWFVENGDIIAKDQEIGEVESEKATLPLIAEQAGRVELLAEIGDTLTVGFIACKIDTSVSPTESSAKEGEASIKKEATITSTKKETASQEPKTESTKPAVSSSANNTKAKATPLAKKMMKENGLNTDDIIAGLKKISTKDVNAVLENKSLTNISLSSHSISREAQRAGMSQLRKKISERLVAVKNETAMLTTFNEVDMSEVMKLRKTHQDKFVAKHGVKLGFMSIFTKAVTLALQQFPNVNSYLEGDEIVTPSYQDVGIAVQTDKGLMVPVIRNTETLGLAEIENQIADLAARARKNRITMEELSGGTFTITNGGIFGSMLSTPILNPPQSAILGMHNIIERPIALNGQVVIRPMMYLALSYDHRIIDGRDSVGFLKTVKAYIEDPGSMLFAGESQENLLLDL